MSVASFLEARGLHKVKGQTYPGTYAIVGATSLFADQVHNRDSASWKKAEHIVVEEIQEDQGSSLLYGWISLTAAEPYGRSIQKLYVAIEGGRYAMYDAEGKKLRIGALSELLG